MRAFLVISALLAVASADVSLGYKYPTPGGHHHHDTPGLVAPSITPSHHHPAPTYVPPFKVESHPQDVQYPSHTSVVHHQTPIVTKHFYIHSAPEEYAEPLTRHVTIGRPQKNYKVVFIKAPESGLSNARITASYAPVEEKTVIYVLNKKPEDINIEDIATPAPTEPSKPEVFFIKYKTPEEAVHAQREIQAQYDALGGSSHVTHETKTPVSSVVGVFDGQNSHNHDNVDTGSSGTASSSVGSVASNYLPPQAYRYRY